MNKKMMEDHYLEAIKPFTGVHAGIFEWWVQGRNKPEFTDLVVFIKDPIYLRRVKIALREAGWKDKIYVYRQVGPGEKPECLNPKG